MDLFVKLYIVLLSTTRTIRRWSRGWHYGSPPRRLIGIYQVTVDIVIAARGVLLAIIVTASSFSPENSSKRTLFLNERIFMS